MATGDYNPHNVIQGDLPVGTGIIKKILILVSTVMNNTSWITLHATLVVETFVQSVLLGLMKDLNFVILVRNITTNN